MCGYIKSNANVQLSCKCLAKCFFLSLVSHSLRHWILWHRGQLSSMNTSAKIDMSINWYPEIGDDVAFGTDKMQVDSSQCQWFLKYMLLLLMLICILHYLEDYFIKSILHLQIIFIVLITFFFFLPMTFLLVEIILFTPRFCTSTSIATVPLPIF